MKTIIVALLLLIWFILTPFLIVISIGFILMDWSAITEKLINALEKS